MTEGPLYTKLYKAWRKTEEWTSHFEKPHPVGSNEWMGNFAYYLNEELRKDYFIIPNNVKDLSSMLKFIDEKDNE